MSPILGILASSAFPQVGDFESIATVTVGAGGQSTVDFTAIPSTYKHLQVRCFTRDARAVTINTLNMRVGNGSIDSGNNYSAHSMQGDGSTASSGGGATTSSMTFMVEPGASATASTFGATVIDLIDYANTNKYKTFRALSGVDINAAGGYVEIVSGVWVSTSAITNIQLFNNATANFSQYSSFALYGIK